MSQASWHRQVRPAAHVGPSGSEVAGAGLDLEAQRVRWTSSELGTASLRGLPWAPGSTEHGAGSSF